MVLSELNIHTLAHRIVTFNIKTVLSQKYNKRYIYIICNIFTLYVVFTTSYYYDLIKVVDMEYKPCSVQLCDWKNFNTPKRNKTETCLMTNPL